jgi:FKBP-type peptidyl-prolyl cis-trans isomerase
LEAKMRHPLVYTLILLIGTACSGVIEDSPSPEDDVQASPLDVAEPSADVQVTASGISYKVLTAGTGTEHPGPRSEVTVHYTGWTTDGKMFDSSIERGEPTSFGLNAVIRGWTEGLQLMVVGEKTRFWIPEKLAYGGRPGKPAGTLVFDIELLSFEAGKSLQEAKGKPAEAKPPEFPEDGSSPPTDATILSEGVHYISLKPPRQPRGDVQPATPTKDNQVELRYNGWTQQGVFVEGITKRGRPETLSMTKVSAAWSQVLMEMAEGQKVRLWASAEASSTPATTATGPMVYELELLRVKEVLPAPADVASPPADATTTDTGLAWRRLKAGTGTVHPSSRAEVEVHYSGWTTDGEMFDSSVVRKKPSSFAANRVIAGWTEGLQLMVEGDSFRFWIPEDLAYQGKENKPAGMLVFDVELLAIKSNPPPPPSAPADAASPPGNATHIEEGIDYITLTKGGTVGPGPDAWVKIHIIDWTQAGVYIGGTDQSNEPIVRRMKDFSPAWSKTLLQMKVGQKVRIWSSQEQSTVGRRTARGDMVTDLELLGIGAAPAAPGDVSEPPSDASFTASGLGYKVLRKGSGKAHPGADSRVEVHYSGWTTDGTLFDSSVQRMSPASFPLNRVIPGWTEGLQLMVTGEKTRFWIPEDQAYKGQPGKPAGMLVFDVELLDIL